MDTLHTEEPAKQEAVTDTPATDTTDESGAADTSTDGTREDAATLLKRLADKDKHIVKLETEARKKADKAKGEPVTRGELEETKWEIAHEDEINLVKDEFEKILADGYHGEKVSKKVALALAFREARVDTSGAKRDRQDDMTTPSVTNRSANPQGYETDADRELGLTVEKKRKMDAKHPHLREV